MRLVFADMDDNQEETGWIEGLTMVISDKPPSSWFDEEVLSLSSKEGNLLITADKDLMMFPYYFDYKLSLQNLDAIPPVLYLKCIQKNLKKLE
jgi:predicted nuclease of predicted toxin-antitoxin system